MPASRHDRSHADSNRRPAPDRDRGPARPGLEALRHRVLESLEGPNPLTLAEIPRRRPFTRAQIEGVVRRLTEEGLVERVEAGSVPAPVAYRATAAGRERSSSTDAVPPRGEAAA